MRASGWSGFSASPRRIPDRTCSTKTAQTHGLCRCRVHAEVPPHFGVKVETARTSSPPVWWSQGSSWSTWTCRELSWRDANSAPCPLQVDFFWQHHCDVSNGEAKWDFLSQEAFNAILSNLRNDGFSWNNNPPKDKFLKDLKKAQVLDGCVFTKNMPKIVYLNGKLCLKKTTRQPSTLSF